MTELSVIIPMYNSEFTIEKCINSIGNRKDIEIILIDDGSTDKTADLCRTYYSRDNVKYIFQANSGPGAARNNGLINSSGNYVMFLDSDDYLDTTVLENIVENTLKLSYDLIYYNFDQVTEENLVIKSYDLSVFHGCTKEDLVNYTLSGRLPWGQFKIIKRDILLKDNIRFEEQVTNFEELLFTLKCIEGSSKIFFVKEGLYKYYKRKGSVSTTITWEKVYDSGIYMADVLLDYYGEVNLGINNFVLLTSIQTMRFLAEQSKDNSGYKIYKSKLQKKIRGLLNCTDDKFYDNRYKMIYNLLKFRMDYIAFTGLKIVTSKEK
jgi:glycosyltransferase involved in cell wall biosynthesis